MYRLLTADEINKYAQDLIGKNYHFIANENKLWILKPLDRNVIGFTEARLDLLAYKLGNKFTNVAEVKFLSKNEYEDIKKLCGLDDRNTIENTYLIRLAESYLLTDLPCSTLEEAVASELVFSTWIRRRDAHSGNRSYVNGIPVFYDHHVAIFGEENTDADTFFSNTSSFGHAGYWRVKQTSENLTTNYVRSKAIHDSSTWSYNFIHDFDEFNNQLDIKTKNLPLILGEDWKQTILEAGFSESEAEKKNINLKQNMQNIVTDIEIMKRTIFKID